MIDLSYTYTVVTWCKDTKKIRIMQVFYAKKTKVSLSVRPLLRFHACK